MTTEQGTRNIPLGVPVLIVDDQAAIRLTFQGILKKRGYDVTLAEDGGQALDLVRKTPFRIVFMDVKMPGISGVEAFVRMKEIRPEIAVVMMTAYAVEDELRRAIREGAYAVIHKPFEMQRALEILEECLEDRTVVLVVDDRFEDRELVKQILGGKGYRVAEAESGEDCLRKIREKRFQVILLDVKLPGIGGLDALKEIKDLQPRAGVIVISGYSQEELIQQALRSGAFSFLRKPFDVPRLLEMMDQCLGDKGKGHG